MYNKSLQSDLKPTIHLSFPIWFPAPDPPDPIFKPPAFLLLTQSSHCNRCPCRRTTYPLALRHRSISRTLLILMHSACWAPLGPLNPNQLISSVYLNTDLDDTRTVPKPRPEEYIRVREQPLFEGYDDELAPLEPITEELANMLCMLQVQRCVDLVENVHWRRLELQKRHNEAQRDE